MGITFRAASRTGTSAGRTGTLLYDDDCGICVSTATWLARRVSPRRLGLLGIRDIPVDPRIAGLVRERALASTLHFVHGDGRVLTGARAVLGAGRLVPGWRFLAILFDHRPGHALLEPLYRLVATNRRRIGRLLGIPATCSLPPRRWQPD